MVEIFYCYEYLYLRRLDIDPETFDEFKKKIARGYEKEISLQLRIYGVEIACPKGKFRPFIRNLIATEPYYMPTSHDSLFSRYLKHCDFVELHLDEICKRDFTLPKELFKCPNIKVLSLRNNNLTLLPAEIGRLQKLEYLALTNNRLENFSIPYSLVFCHHLIVLLLDNNLLDALPGFLLYLPNLTTVHRHGNHNYFQSTFMWYHSFIHTYVHQRIVELLPDVAQKKETSVQKLLYLSAKAVIAGKLNFFFPSSVPQVLVDYICSIYLDFNICFNCAFAKLQPQRGYKVITFKNPYLGNTCVPFQHWACSLDCAKAIEFPAREEQLQSSLEQDRLYYERVKEAEEFGSRANDFITSTCNIL